MGRTSSIFAAVACALMGAIEVPQLAAQERPAKRLAMIVSVAMTEYGLAVDDQRRVVNDIEYEEAVTFLADAREVAARLSGDRAPQIRALLDSMAVGVGRKEPPAAVRALHAQVIQAMGADAALDMPTRRLDPAEGQRVYEANCASCHGSRGLGDGPQARALNPPPPALGDAEQMATVTPAMMYNIISVGVAGTSMVGWAGTLTPDQRWNVIAYLNGLRAPQPTAPGEGLYLQRCAGCHGVTGMSDGDLTRALSRLPAELSSFAWHVDRSDAQIGAVIREGVTGTAMPPARELSAADVAQLVAHVRRLALEDVPALVATTDSTDGAAAAQRVLGLLDDALAALRAGRRADANDRAFDSYIAFEPLETVARARNPGLVASMERQFADFKGAVKAGDIRGAERARDAVEAGMPGILELVQPTTGFWGNFLQSFLIILREGFEAILVVGAVVTFLVKTGNRRRLRAVWVGVGAALVASGVTAVILATVLRALPATREIIEGITMLVAVAVLFSVSYWLISKVEAAKWQQFIRDKVNDALQHGGGRALSVVAFLAVYREGAETALFYQALLRDGAGMPIALGILVGGAALAIVFTLFYRYGVRLPLRPFFAGTSALLYYMAFVFMGKGIRELQEGNVVPITVLPGWPHVEAMGIYPSVQTLLAQLLLVVLFVLALLKTFWPKRSVTLPTVPPPSPGPTVIDARVKALEEKVREMEQTLVVEEQSQGADFRR
ncbi:MAG: cytochrome c/FTR1 family iron permease [Gemmatimonadetes bacterium]|nr:cytochrome c/FTR1 family iron permease [Gemmatimonadota bacterium]